MAEQPQLDPGLSSILQQILGAGGAGGTPAPPQQGITQQELQSLLLGTVRQSLTTRPLTGVQPTWIPPQLGAYVQQGAVDPYLGTGDPSTFRVFMGGQQKIKTRQEYHTKDDAGGTISKMVNSTEDKTLTVEQAVNQPYLWSEEEVAGAIKKFQGAGITSVTDFDSLSKAWGSLVQRAGAMYSMSSGSRKVTPWDVLDIYQNEQIKAGTLHKPGPGDPDFNGSTTQVSRSVSDISEGDAWANLQRSLSAMLGRDPSDQELRDFTYRMNSLASHNPSITKTISQYKNGQVSTQSSHTSEGFTANDLAQQAYEGAQADPDYAEYQAATTYFNALSGALGAIGG